MSDKPRSNEQVRKENAEAKEEARLARVERDAELAANTAPSQLTAVDPLGVERIITTIGDEYVEPQTDPDPKEVARLAAVAKRLDNKKSERIKRLTAGSAEVAQKALKEGQKQVSAGKGAPDVGTSSEDANKGAEQAAKKAEQAEAKAKKEAEQQAKKDAEAAAKQGGTTPTPGDTPPAKPGSPADKAGA